MRRALACALAVAASAAAVAASDRQSGAQPIKAPPAALLAQVAETPDDVASRAALVLWYYDARQLSLAARELDALVSVLTRQAAAAPPPRPTGAEPRRAAVDVPVPAKVKDVTPMYSLAAMRSKQQGIVLLDLLIDAKGKVASVEVIRGVGLPDEAAVRAARKWEFAPTVVDGVSVPVRLTVPVRFAFCGTVGLAGFVDMAHHFSVNGFAGAAMRSAEAARKELRSEIGWSSPEGQAAWSAVDAPGRISEPKKIKDVKPTYPTEALAAKIEGVVAIEAIIDETGRVARMKTIRCDGPFLEASAIEAIRQWEYEPLLMDGKPVKVVMTLTVQYSLR